MQKVRWLLVLLVGLSLVLSACSAEEWLEEEPAAVELENGEEEYYEQGESQQEVVRESEGEEEAAAESEFGEDEAGGEGQYTVDTGFRPAENGFIFENYGEEAYTPDYTASFPVMNLTPVELRRMFGDDVCAADLEAEECILTPPARQWMEENNAAMSGGHCEGLAVMSQLFFGGLMAPDEFGAGSPGELVLEDNDALQRELAYWWSTQGTVWESQRVAGASEQVEFLMQAYQEDPANLYRIGILKADGTGGHAITAYAVQDQGDGIFQIMVYDNNFPGQERFIEVDTNSDTWQYEASINPEVEPELYTGDANNPMLLAPNEPRLGVLPCPFCAGEMASKGGRGLAQATMQYNQVWMDGDAGLLLVDDNDRRIGYDEGEFINEIPEIQFRPTLGQNRQSLSAVTAPPVYNVPMGLGFTAVIDGSSVPEGEPVDLVMIGPGYYLGVEDIYMDPGQVDQLYFDGEGDFITYTTDYAETPVIIVGIEKEEADFELQLIGTDIEPGTDIHVLFDQVENVIALSTTSEADGSYQFAITRIDDEGEESFETSEEDPIVLSPGDVLYFYFGEWEGTGSNLEIGYDAGGDGTVDETVNMGDTE